MMMLRQLQLLRVPVVIFAFLVLAEGSENQQPKSKRQIYREQVLPSRGGKIPDGAFRTDRLALNRLNKEGIAIPDGILLEHRLVHSHPHINKHDPEDEAAVIQIIQREENRFVAAPGKYHHQTPLTIPSTYIIRKPIGPESAVLRSPAQQMPHQIFRHHFQNQPGFNSNGYQQQQYVSHLHQHLPTVKFGHSGFSSAKYNPVEIPSKKYLPSSSSQKYLSPNFRLPSKKLLQQTYNPTVVHHPHPYGYETPISYQSVSYFPIHVPLVLPNKELQTTDYYRVKGEINQGVNSNVHSNDIHNVIDWPTLLAHYSQVSNKLDALNQEPHDVSKSHSQFITPEVLGSIDSDSNYYLKSVGRYVRKSKQPETKKSARKSQLRCNGEEGNTVGEESTHCPV